MTDHLGSDGSHAYDSAVQGWLHCSRGAFWLSAKCRSRTPGIGRQASLVISRLNTFN